MITNSQSSMSSVDSPSAAVRNKRRRVGDNNAEPQLEEENDAEAVRNRRIQHIVETARSLHSPSGSPGADRRNRGVVGRNGMTNVQISEHYANCLKLCAENKINAKNAFNLHLIDFMSDMLRERTDSETNFQVAGTSLDASAKIYAYRVESVHRETLRIAGGLGRPDRDGHRRGEEDDIAEDEHGETGENPAPKAPKKRRKRITKGHTIETNERSLNHHVGDSEYPSDAYFDKVRSNFDEGTSSGLFLNTLLSICDSSRLMLHCLTEHPPKSTVSSVTSVNGPRSDLSDMHDLLASLDLNNKTTMCNRLNNFSFNQCELIVRAEDEQTDPPEWTTSKRKITESTGNFAVQLPPTPPPPQPDFGLEVETEDDGDVSDVDPWDRASVVSVANELEPGEKPVTTGTVRPMEWPCFDPNNISMLSGDTHWRVKAKLHSLKRELTESKSTAGGPVAKTRKLTAGRPRKRKTEPRVSFDEEMDVNSVVPMGSGATVLSKVALEKWKSDSANLDMDDTCKADSLQHMFTKPNLWLLPEGDLKNANGQKGRADDEIGSHSQDDYGHDDDVDEIDFETVMDAGAGGDPPVGGEIPGGGGGGGGGGGVAIGGLFGDGLLQPARVVRKETVPYERKAKRIDARRVKRAVWSVLTREESPNCSQESSPTATSVGGSPSKRMTGPKKFTQVCAELPNIVPPTTAENLSVPIVFVCLLHLCNENGLSLENQDDLADITISTEASDQY